jgi:purine-nucleoside phosphorylase
MSGTAMPAPGAGAGVSGAAAADPYAAARVSAAGLAELTGLDRYDAAVVLGSGWAPAADAAAAALGAEVTQIPVARLGGFVAGTVAGHQGVVRSLTVPVPGGAAAAPPGDAGGRPPAATPPGGAGGRPPAATPPGGAGGRPPAATLRLLVFLGRVHLYEGHPVAAVVHGVRTAAAAGCRAVVLTNAAGGIREGYRVGQPVLIRDHLNLTARSPLTGPPPPEPYGSRFTDLTDLYSARLRALARAADPDLAEGVYAALPGPHYETPAEIAMLRLLGADLVGMSTALEAIAARHLGLEVLGLSLVTNLAAGLSPAGLDHSEVVAAGAAATDRLGALLARILPQVVAV